MNNLFVYGTLMQGHSRNSVINRFEWSPAVLYGYKRHLPERLGYPFIVPHKESKVEGEVYFSVDEETLEIVDKIEGEGELYHRIKVTVHLLESKEQTNLSVTKGDICEAWTFLAGEWLISQFI
ncbi:MAG: gamma-glutamylcyclotransferase family protein [Promethearchaeota archaeon]